MHSRMSHGSLAWIVAEWFLERCVCERGVQFVFGGTTLFAWQVRMAAQVEFDLGALSRSTVLELQVE